MNQMVVCVFNEMLLCQELWFANLRLSLIFQWLRNVSVSAGLWSEACVIKRLLIWFKMSLWENARKLICYEMCEGQYLESFRFQSLRSGYGVLKKQNFHIQSNSMFISYSIKHWCEGHPRSSRGALGGYIMRRSLKEQCLPDHFSCDAKERYLKLGNLLFLMHFMIQCLPEFSFKANLMYMSYCSANKKRIKNQ